MKRSTWPLIAIVAVFTLGIVSALVITNHAEQQAAVQTATATSAATSIITFLVTVILALVLAAVGVVIGWQWWKHRQRRQKMQDALHQAQIYALLQGAQSPRTSAGRARVPGLDQAGGNTIVFPGSGQQTAPQLTAGDLRAMMSGQTDPLASLFPPDAGGWEVV